MTLPPVSDLKYSLPIGTASQGRSREITAYHFTSAGSWTI